MRQRLFRLLSHHHCFPFVLSTILLLGSCQPAEKTSQHRNHLAGQSSPYLLQHATNPVDWYPWGAEALRKARDENKMLLISIGYAACHWCHVMERESFEDTTVARLMNEHFVSIKVDREERPDIDDIYMTACQLGSDGSCGWPLNAFALPDGRPVWAGTYFPRKQWIEILDYFIEIGVRDRDKLETYADRLQAGIIESDLQDLGSGAQAIDRQLPSDLAQKLLEATDWRNGGRQGSPKFPMPAVYEFLLRQYYYSGNTKALRAVTLTLEQMARGGIYDQIGGGFARYATDTAWRVPHFEKMLYDNAQLVSLYAHAYQATGTPQFKRVIEETLAFVERELTAPDGGFYSSIDADSDGEEGQFYVWTASAIDSLFPEPGLAALVTEAFEITEKGNWEEGKNILHRPTGAEMLAAHHSLDTAEVRILLGESRQRLFSARQSRPRPRTDDKILTGWNALMLSAYLDAYQALGQDDYLEVALRNGHFLKAQVMDSGFRLYRNFKNGRASINAFLDDYALTSRAFIDLYEATFDEAWLYAARGLADYAIQHFYDDSRGLFFYTSSLDPPLVARTIETSDDVIPGSNSSMARVLHDLSLYFYHERYLDTASSMVRKLTGAMQQAPDPAFFANWAILTSDLVNGVQEVAIVGPDCMSRRWELSRHYLPDVRLLGGSEEGKLELLKGKKQEGKTMIYVCRQKVCKLPVASVAQALELIAE